jgi:hypothetical protein
MPDPEIEAMSAVADALAVLDDDDTRSRVLRWAAEKYHVALPQLSSMGVAAHHARTSGVGVECPDDEVDEDEEINSGPQKSPANGSAASSTQFDHFAELFDAVRPQNDMEKAMTAAYWEQVIRGRNDWQSQTINKELKDLGHYITAINKALTAGMQTKPALVLQLKKTGAAQQGRKTCKLSSEGVKFIRSRIAQSV